MNLVDEIFDIAKELAKDPELRNTMHQTWNYDEYYRWFGIDDLDGDYIEVWCPISSEWLVLGWKTNQSEKWYTEGYFSFKRHSDNQLEIKSHGKDSSYLKVQKILKAKLGIDEANGIVAL